MNQAISTTSARTWHAVKAHYLTAFTAAALAVAAVVSVPSLNIDWGSKSRPIDKAIPPQAAFSADQKSVTFYLVASEAERERVIAIEDEAAKIRYDNNTFEPNSSYTIFVARTPEEVVSATMAIYEMMSILIESGTAVNHVDRITH